MSQLRGRRSCPDLGEEESTQAEEWGGSRSTLTLCDPRLGPDPASPQTRGSLRAAAPRCGSNVLFSGAMAQVGAALEPCLGGQLPVGTSPSASF